MHKGKSLEISIFQGFYFISETWENISFSMKIVVTMRSEDAQKIRILIFGNLGRSQNGHTEIDKKKNERSLRKNFIELYVCHLPLFVKMGIYTEYHGSVFMSHELRCHFRLYV